ncbi:MAG TPA: carbonic anhydrase [Solirubrobacterales bacterium]
MGLPAAPARKLAVITCMDARIDPFELLDLRLGDAHVIRNAGGIITDDTIRSLSISQRKLGTEEVVLIQHTGCGLLTFTDEEYAAEIEADAGERPHWQAHTFTDLERSVRDGVERVRSSPFVPNTATVRGLVYEVETGRLREVHTP